MKIITLNHVNLGTGTPIGGCSFCNTSGMCIVSEPLSHYNGLTYRAGICFNCIEQLANLIQEDSIKPVKPTNAGDRLT